jgi:plasmid stability protein
MTQVTWRAPDELAERVRESAARAGRSMNEFITGVLDAATDPESAGTEIERIRERLARAGVLADHGPRHRRPDAESVAQARRAAAHGTPLSELVERGRG